MGYKRAVFNSLSLFKEDQDIGLRGFIFILALNLIVSLIISTTLMVDGVKMLGEQLPYFSVTCGGLLIIGIVAFMMTNGWVLDALASMFIIGTCGGLLGAMFNGQKMGQVPRIAVVVIGSLVILSIAAMAIPDFVREKKGFWCLPLPVLFMVWFSPKVLKDLGLPMAELTWFGWIVLSILVVHSWRVLHISVQEEKTLSNATLGVARWYSDPISWILTPRSRNDRR
jgi:hypothetical protein